MSSVVSDVVDQVKTAILAISQLFGEKLRPKTVTLVKHTNGHFLWLVAHITNNRFYFSSVVSDVVDQVMSSAIL
jgi:hypothetical protein